jgi:predicted HTH domain antitoxin
VLAAVTAPAEAGELPSPAGDEKAFGPGHLVATNDPLQDSLFRSYTSPMMHTATFEFGDDVLLATGQSPSEFAEEARFLLAAKLYELGRLSSEQAAKLCGQTRVSFLIALPRVGVSASNLSADDLEDELAFSRNG